MGSVVERVWVDLETTGLKPRVDAILELGVMLTDKWGELINYESWLVGSNSPLYQTAIERAKRDSVVGPMHQASGLWEEWKYALADVEIQMIPGQVEDMVLDFLDENGVEHGKLPMCGSSVHFDRTFLEHHMPKLESNFSYRNIDVSTMRELAKDFNPRLAEVPEKRKPQVIEHRALGDLAVTLELYRHYVENFLFVAEDA